MFVWMVILTVNLRSDPALRSVNSATLALPSCFIMIGPSHFTCKRKQIGWLFRHKKQRQTSRQRKRKLEHAKRSGIFCLKTTTKSEVLTCRKERKIAEYKGKKRLTTGAPSWRQNSRWKRAGLKPVIALTLTGKQRKKQRGHYSFSSFLWSWCAPTPIWKDRWR